MVVAVSDGVDGFTVVPEKIASRGSGAVQRDDQTERVLPAQNCVSRRFLRGHYVTSAHVNGDEVERSVEQNVLAVGRNLLSLIKRLNYLTIFYHIKINFKNIILIYEPCNNQTRLLLGNKP